MADPKTSSPQTPARGTEIPAIPARWGFTKGLMTGAAIEIPAIAATVWVLSRAGIGDANVPFMHVLRLTTVFAGIAALLTAGGIGRLAAHAAAEGGRRRAMFVAARAHAMASAGLVLIATVPHGELPATSLGFLPIPIAGLVCGALCGVLIGAVCGGVAPVGLADVWSLAKRPSVALKQLLGPEDIVRLGSALRSRTTHLFEGIFEPAPKPPEAPPTDPKAKSPETK
ncbi:MAG: hypothetical protein ACKV2T_31615 [Kofleriaceae bacterium]